MAAQLGHEAIGVDLSPTANAIAREKASLRGVGARFVVGDVSMPGPVRAFAENQPVPSLVNAIRDLLTGQPVGSDIWSALAWCTGILVVAYLGATAVYRRKVG